MMASCGSNGSSPTTPTSVQQGDKCYSYIPFMTPTSIIVAGSSFSGKTTFVHKLLLHGDKMFENPPVEIMLCYLVWQPIYDDIEATVQNVTFFEGVPSKEDIENFTEDRQHRLIILDDLMTKLNDSPQLVDLFTCFVHHRNVSSIFILQNLFHSCSKGYLRDISLNAQGIILFKNMRSPQQVGVLGSQLFPGGKRKFFMEAYEKACSAKFGHLFININPRDSDNYQLQSNILPDSDTIVYLPN
jgi:hypothetical protein